MKNKFYPNLLDKKDLLKEGYVANISGHARGSTVDLAIVNKNNHYYTGCQKNHKALRLDFDTGIDCMAPTAHTNAPILPELIRKNRLFLKRFLLSQE